MRRQGHLGRSAGAWFSDVGRLWWTIVVTGLLGLAALASAVASARRHLPWIVVGAMGLLLVASFVAYHREQSRRLTAPHDHIARLREVTRHLNAAVVDRRRILVYTDGSHFGPTLGAIWRSHATSEAAVLDEYENAEEPYKDATAALDRLIEETVDLDRSVGWLPHEMVRALRSFVERRTTFDLECESIPAGDGTDRQRLVLAHVDSEKFVIWISEVAPIRDLPSLDEPQRILEQVKGSIEYAKAILEFRHMQSTRTTALMSLERILGRDGYFPGDCTDLCRNPDA